MIKFFRKIRKQLLTENLTGRRAGKYLIYAFGEILLIVTGVLIAVQINNRNELNKEKGTEIEYLHRFNDDLQKDTLYLNQKISFAQKQYETFHSFIAEMHKSQNKREDVTKLISSVIWDAQNLIIQDKTYSEMINSGKFSIISRKSIKESIEEYYRNCMQAEKHIAEMNQTGINLFLDIYTLTVKYYDSYSNIYSEDMFYKKNWEFINDPTSIEFRELEGAASYHYYKQTVLENYYNNIKSEAKRLIAQIDESYNIN